MRGNLAIAVREEAMQPSETAGAEELYLVPFQAAPQDTAKPVEASCGRFVLDDDLLLDSQRFHAVMMQAFAARNSRCTFDLSAISYLFYGHVGMLMLAVEEAKRHNCRIALQGAQRPMAKLLELARFERYCDIVE